MMVCINTEIAWVAQTDKAVTMKLLVMGSSHVVRLRRHILQEDIKGLDEQLNLQQKGISVIWHGKSGAKTDYLESKWDLIKVSAQTSSGWSLDQMTWTAV